MLILLLLTIKNKLFIITTMIDSRYLSLYKIEKKLGFLEEKILFLIKEKGNSSREVLKELIKESKKNYAYTTVMTIMDKLYKKGFLKREKRGKTYFYFLAEDIKKLKEKSIIYLINNFFEKINFFTLFAVLLNFFILDPIIFLFKKPLIKGLNLIFLIFLICIISIQSIYQFYTNGFFVFFKIFITEPSFLFSNLSLNFNYLFENLIYVFLLCIILFFFKKIKNFYF